MATCPFHLRHKLVDPAYSLVIFVTSTSLLMTLDSLHRPTENVMQEIHRTFVKREPHYFVVETYHENGKARQQVIVHLDQHKTVEEALKHWQQLESTAKTGASKDHAREMIEKLNRCLPPVQVV